MNARLHLVSEKGSERANPKIVARDGKLHVVWQDSLEPARYETEDSKGGAVPRGGYVNRVRTFDVADGEWSETVTLGEAVDNHARPEIAVDGEGFLHVVLGGHHTPVTYRRSVRPNDASEWTEPEMIGVGTYPKFVVLGDGTLAVAMRAPAWRGDDLYIKRPGESWRGPRLLVAGDPDYPGYGAFHADWAVESRAEAHGDILHLTVGFYESKGIREDRGLYQAIAYMRSTDGGRSWERADGTPVRLPARPEAMDWLARDVAPERHEQLATPILPARTCVTVDGGGRPHVVYIDHRFGSGQIVHATPDGESGWRRTLLPEIDTWFPGYAATEIGNFQYDGANGFSAVAKLAPTGEGWHEGLPTRAMVFPEGTLHVRLRSRDMGKTWTARKLFAEGGQRHKLDFADRRGIDRSGDRQAAPFVYFEGPSRYPKKGESIQNKVYLAMPEAGGGEAPETPAAVARLPETNADALWTPQSGRPAVLWLGGLPENADVAALREGVAAEANVYQRESGDRAADTVGFSPGGKPWALIVAAGSALRPAQDKAGANVNPLLRRLKAVADQVVWLGRAEADHADEAADLAERRGVPVIVPQADRSATDRVAQAVHQGLRHRFLAQAWLAPPRAVEDGWLEWRLHLPGANVGTNASLDAELDKDRGDGWTFEAPEIRSSADPGGGSRVIVQGRWQPESGSPYPVPKLQLRIAPDSAEENGDEIGLSRSVPLRTLGAGNTLAHSDLLPPAGASWAFRKDPEGKGVERGWHEGRELGDWERIRVPAFWAHTDVGDYHGDGWYAAVFNAPEALRDRWLQLHFGGIDKEAWIYLNGERIARHTTASTGQPVGVLWNAPFYVPIPPDAVRFGESNRLVIRMRSERAGAGIHRPVRLGVAAGQSAPEESP